jgi:hypothetical protein
MIRHDIMRDIRVAQEHIVSVLQYTSAGCDRFIEGLGRRAAGYWWPSRYVALITCRLTSERPERNHMADNGHA